MVGYGRYGHDEPHDDGNGWLREFSLTKTGLAILPVDPGRSDSSKRESY